MKKPNVESNKKPAELGKIIENECKVQKKEFSKKIFTGVTILTVYVVLLSSVMMIITRSVEPLTYLIPAVFAEFATATGFYYSKAKAENKLKIAKQEKVRVIEKEVFSNGDN